MSRCLVLVSHLLVAAFVTACWTTVSLAQQGPPTRDVNVANTPLPVTGSLAVQGAVTLAPGTSVNVNSSVQNPVRVRSVNDAIQPVQVSTTCSTSALGCLPNIYTVPVNKRLVIEYASMNVCVLPGQSAQFSISTSVGGTSATHYLNTAPPAASPGSSAIGCNSAAASSTTAVGQQIRLYADPGTTVTVEGARANGVNGNQAFSFSISGYLVDVPLTP